MPQKRQQKRAGTRRMPMERGNEGEDELPGNYFFPFLPDGAFKNIGSNLLNVLPLSKRGFRLFQSRLAV